MKIIIVFFVFVSGMAGTCDLCITNLTCGYSHYYGLRISKKFFRHVFFPWHWQDSNLQSSDLKSPTLTIVLHKPVTNITQKTTP